MTSESPTQNQTQLQLARAAKWHQDGTPLLTLDALRTWLTASGLVLYTPRPAQLPSPAPSFVEATLGAVNAEPTLAEIDNARSLLARLISDGAALPLNLLGTTGSIGTDVPDFIVSAQVFSYVFTLRGNKAWKQPPQTSGPVKVSPLAAATYEILTAKISLSASDLATELGKEITESAVLRALTELWGQLRVIPVPQVDGTATLWEQTSTRFTKQIKSGANAGQPSALSALISLYLGQALAATEDEIETFLSPLAPRSRIRDVIHALLPARQLETVVIEGKTLLHLAGDAPTVAAGSEAEAVASPEAQGGAEPELAADGSRIRKFTPKPGSKIGTGLRSKPAFGNKPSFGAPGRERRPFQRDSKPAFNKPWEEERAARTPPSGNTPDLAASADAPRPAFAPRPSFERRPAFGNKPAFGGGRPGGKPRFEPRREGFAPKPRFDREASSGEGRPARPYTPRPSGPPSDGDAVRRTFSKPGTFGRKREGFSPRPSGEGAGGSRPPRRDFGARPERPAGSGFSRPGSFGDRPQGGFANNRPDRPDRSERPSRPAFPRENAGGATGPEAPRKIFRKFDAPRAPKPFGSKPFGGKSFGASGGGDQRSPRPFDNARAPRSFNAGSAARPPRPFNGDGASRPPRRDTPDAPDRPRFDRSGSGSEGRPGSGGKPSGGFGAKKSFGSGHPSGPGGPSGGRSGVPSGGFKKPGGPFAKFADGAKPFRKPGKPSGGGFNPTRRRDGGA